MFRKKTNYLTFSHRLLCKGFDPVLTFRFSGKISSALATGRVGLEGINPLSWLDKGSEEKRRLST